MLPGYGFSHFFSVFVRTNIRTMAECCSGKISQWADECGWDEPHKLGSLRNCPMSLTFQMFTIWKLEFQKWCFQFKNNKWKQEAVRRLFFFNNILCELLHKLLKYVISYLEWLLSLATEFLATALDFIYLTILANGYWQQDDRLSQFACDWDVIGR